MLAGLIDHDQYHRSQGLPPEAVIWFDEPLADQIARGVTASPITAGLKS